MAAYERIDNIRMRLSDDGQAQAVEFLSVVAGELVVLAEVAVTAEAQAALVALTVKPWQPGVEVKTGEVYSHGGSNWRVMQDHTTADHWQPGSPGLEALYAEV